MGFGAVAPAAVNVGCKVVVRAGGRVNEFVVLVVEEVGYEVGEYPGEAEGGFVDATGEKVACEDLGRADCHDTPAGHAEDAASVEVGRRKYGIGRVGFGIKEIHSV